MRRRTLMPPLRLTGVSAKVNAWTVVTVNLEISGNYGPRMLNRHESSPGTRETMGLIKLLQ